jgi:signal transduction histidine kinase
MVYVEGPAPVGGEGGRGSGDSAGPAAEVGAVRAELAAAQAELAAARRRLAFLDGLAAHIAECDEPTALLDGVARLGVPVLGTWLGIYLVNEAGGLELVSEAGGAEAGAVVEAHLRRGARARIERSCECGDVVVLDGLPATPGGPRGSGCGVVVPLAVRGRSLGALAATAGARPGEPGGPDMALLTDVAHRLAFALDRTRLLAEATEAANAREEFIHVASHELRAPIATLHLTVHLLHRDARSGPLAASEDRLRVLDRQVARMVALSETLLDVTRITAGRLELNPDEGDLAALVREVAEWFVDDAAEQESTLTVDAPAPVACAFDRVRMEQVVSNLVSNAVKYGRGGPVRISVSAEGDRARVEVQDRGIGIAPADQDRIFGRFERAVPSRNYSGLGLGLWIVKRLVEAHGGTIRVASAPGEGSTFTVDLPRKLP